MVEELNNPADRDPEPEGPLQHATVRFEHSDVSFRWILGILSGAFVIGVVILYGVLRFFYSYQDYQTEIKSSEYPVMSDRHTSLPAEPRLEQIERMAGREKANVYIKQEQKETILNGYGEAEEGYVHIPIGRAMDFLADKLSSRMPPSQEQARRQNGLVGSGASNSGRMFRGAPHD